MTAPSFLDEDFLLHGETARRLYHDVARKLPIVDYHCHLPAAELAQNHQFSSITELWLDGDHYKWRAMRAAGVPERCCTGDASPWEKFEAWAATVPATLRNPLYHWTHLELKRPFGIRRLLDPKSAREVYELCNARLQDDGFRARGLVEGFKVEVLCTTDDPTDPLDHHEHLARQQTAVRVLPTWRPDAALGVEDAPAFNAWVDRLGAAANLDIGGLERLLEALDVRHQFFHDRGCRLSDQGLERIEAEDAAPAELARLFSKLRGGQSLRGAEAAALRSGMLLELARMNHRRGWAQQFHLGALRNNNQRMLAAIGPNTGFDSIGDAPQAKPLARFLDRLDRAGQLARTILYNANPRDNELFATMIGNYQDGRVRGKMQYGSAWWFLDQRDGIERQLEALSHHGLLSTFVGMVTDSRSFLSYSRHEYFRRILCNLLGSDVDRGRLPSDPELVDRLVRGICYQNAVEYFGFSRPEAA